jgi:putative transposase
MLHQLSSSLARTKPVIVLEDLHVRGMQYNRHLALSISDAGFGELRRQVAYKSDWYGARLVVADRYFPSTQLCSHCGCLNGQTRGFSGLSRRTFACRACGVLLDRDTNAASNLRAYGLRELGIAPLPVDRREVTPDGEEGSGSTPRLRAKPASAKQEASGPAVRGRLRRGGAKGPPGTGLALG